MTACITLDRNMTPRQVAKAAEAPPRSMRKLAGSHVADIVALCKSLILCPLCRPKFDPAKHGYIDDPRIPLCRGRCDGCRQPHARAHLLVHRSHAHA